MQTTTSTGLNVVGDPATNRCVASDDKGDFVVVWLQYDDDSYTDVYMRLYNQHRQPVDQRNARQYLHSEESDGTVGGDGRGRRFRHRLGQPRPGSRRCELGDLRPAVQFGWEPRSAASSASTPTRQTTKFRPTSPWTAQGDFIVVWATQGQAYSYFNTVEGQLYSYDGEQDGRRIPRQLRAIFPAPA